MPEEPLRLGWLWEVVGVRTWCCCRLFLNKGYCYINCVVVLAWRTFRLRTFRLLTPLRWEGKSRLIRWRYAIVLAVRCGSDNVPIKEIIFLFWMIGADARLGGVVNWSFDLGGYRRGLVFGDYDYTLWGWGGLLFKHSYVLARWYFPTVKRYNIILDQFLLHFFFFDVFFMFLFNNSDEFFFVFPEIRLDLTSRILIIRLRISDVLPICLLIFYKVFYDR